MFRSGRTVYCMACPVVYWGWEEFRQLLLDIPRRDSLKMFAQLPFWCYLNEGFKMRSTGERS